jgi:excisionase family DNA binding protein
MRTRWRQEASTVYWTVSQAARRLCVSDERVRQFIREGTLPAIKTPLGWLIRIADVEALAAERERMAEEVQ